MIKIFTLPSRKSCRDAVAHIVNYGLPFTQRRVNLQPLTIDELKTLVEFTDESPTEILAENSNDYATVKAELAEIDMTFEDLTLQELHYIVRKYPKIMRTPIMIDEKQMIIGFNEDTITTLIPRKVRMQSIYDKLEMMREMEEEKMKAGKSISGGIPGGYQYT